MELQKDNTITVSLNSMSYGGEAVGRYEGKTVFVADALPGDTVKARIDLAKPKFLKATTTEVLERSPLRQASPCSYSQICGGCQWLEVPYEQQATWKRQFVADNLTRIGKLTLPADFSLLPAPSERNYRNRVLLRGTLGKESNITLGFLQKSSHQQVPIHRCYVADQQLNTVIAKLAATPSLGQGQKFRLELQTLPAYAAKQTACVTALVHPVGGVDTAFEGLMAALKTFPEILWAGFTGISTKETLPFFAFEEVDGLSYFTAPGQFTQINVEHNHTLRRLVADAVKSNPASGVLVDLFCGSGNLSLGLADGLRRIEGVESNPIAIQVAQHAVAFNRLQNTHYHAQDAGRFLQKLTSEKAQISTLIADPPRAGMKECLPYVQALNPQTIVYVSCDTATLARDLAILSTQYRLESVTALDFFPQTYHVETVAVLQRI